MTGPDLALLLIVVTGAFFVKAITGMGGPILAIPLLAPVMGFEEAVVAVSFANIVSNLLLVWDNRSAARRAVPVLRSLVPAGLVGAVAGSLLLVRLDDRWLMAALATIVLGYIGLTSWKGQITLRPALGRRLAAPVGLAAGITHGATGNSGAVIVTFLHSLDLPRTEFVFTATVPFMLLSAVQVTTLSAIGRLDHDIVVAALVAVLPVLAVTPIGTRVGRRLNQRTFSMAVLGLLGIAALRLILGVFGV